MMPILHIGPLAIQFPGLIILLGLWLGLSLAERFVDSHTKRYAKIQDIPGSAELQPIPAPILYNLAVGSLLAAIIGARLFYILQYTQIFIQNPASIISLNTSLLDLRGAFIGALVYAFYYGQRKNLHLWQSLDALTPAFAVLAIAYHLSNLASGENLGSPTQLPWAIELWGALRHPVQLYEAIFAALILFLLWPTQPKISAEHAGEYFINFIALSSGSRLFFEAFHGDSQLVLSGFRLGQIYAWIILSVCFYGLHRLAHSPKRSEVQTELPNEKG